MQNSIFTQIINGDIPSYKVYEDDDTYAFLDIHPLTEGHVLVVPKLQVDYIWDLPTKEYQALMATVQKVGKRLKEVLDAPYVGVEVIGVDVPHAHVHVVPFHTPSDLHAATPMDNEPDHESLAQIAKKIAFS